MAQLRLRKFGSHEELDFFLRGGLTSGPLPSSGSSSNPVVYGLNGKTLIFNTPAVTVTFTVTGGAQAGIDLKGIADQIKTALGGNYAVTYYQRMLRIVATAGGSIVLSKNGTSNTILGLPTDTDTTTTKYNAPSGAAPRYIEVNTFGPSESILLLTTEE